MKRLAMLACLLAGVTLTAQDKAHRPRAGLVLEGGRALGLAHIGVLRFLEERKEDRIAFPSRLELGLKHKKLTFQLGLNSGHQTGLVIDRATLAYDDKLDFDELPIRFRCVATDMTIGMEKVFEKGSIAQALRATMAIPAVFTPVMIDGHTYTDRAR